MRLTNRGLWVGSTLGVLALVLAGFGLAFASYSSVTEVTTVVTDKERVCETKGDCRYLIFTEAGTFENTDSLFMGKFNSSDVQGSINVGSEYDIVARGWRIGLLSSYPNVERATPVE